MKDMPIFTTEHGVASLTLREIPYSKKAYIRIQNATDERKLIHKCADFCRAVGAQEVFATGNLCYKTFPVHTEIWEMTCMRSMIPETDAIAVPLDEAMLSGFKDIYNDLMRNVPNAAYLTIQGAQDILKEKTGYAVMQCGRLIGIGIASVDTVDMLGALERGKGKAVLSALCAQLSSETVHVVVASANTKAVSLYERLGFQVSAILGKWIKIP